MAMATFGFFRADSTLLRSRSGNRKKRQITIRTLRFLLIVPENHPASDALHGERGGCAGFERGDIWRVGDNQLTCARHTAGTTAFRKLDQPPSGSGNPFIDANRRGGIIRLDIVEDRVAIFACKGLPGQLHGWRAPAFRRAASRRRAKCASVSSSE